MKREFSRRFLPFIIVLFAAGGRVSAFDQQAITVVNNSGADAADLHAYFSGAGGDLYVDPFGVIALSCPTPTVPTNFTITDSAVIDWGVTCVPPGGAVTFIVSTANGPLKLDSVCWTDEFNVIISCQTDSMTTDSLPPFGPFGALKIQVQCRPRGPGFYTLWFPPGTISPRCWARWCCRATTDYYYRIVWCPFTTRLARFLELPPWFRLTNWRRDGTVGPQYFWIFRTYPPHPDSIIGVGPNPNWPPIGPGGPWPPWAGGMKVINTDDGTTFRPAADFATSFFDVFYEIQLESNTVDTFPTLQDQLMVHAPHYFEAANLLNNLINETNQVNAFEPHPFLSQIVLDLQRLQNALLQMANAFIAGMAGPPVPYQEARDAFNDLAMVFANDLSAYSPRYLNASNDLLAMSEGFDIALQAVLLDPSLSTPPVQDMFRYGLFNRFFLNLPSAATGSMAHIRTQVDLGDHAWFPSIQDEVHVIHQSGLNFEMQDMILGLSDQSSFDLPIVYEISIDRSGAPDRMWFKLPAYLGKQVDFAPSDGLILGSFALIPGDVNNDNCVDEADSLQVESEMGQGGDTASVVPSSDVNADGLVDSTDLNIVIANMGQCGDVFTPLSPGCCVGVRGDPNNDGAEANILDLTYAVDRIFRGGPPAVCPEEGDPNGDGASLNILDLTYFVDRIFRGGPPPVPCI